MPKLVSVQDWSDRRWAYRVGGLLKRIDTPKYRANPDNIYHESYLKMCTRLLLANLAIITLSLLVNVYGVEIVTKAVFVFVVGSLLLYLATLALITGFLTIYAWVTVMGD